MEKIERKPLDKYFLELAFKVAERSTCRRRHIGASGRNVVVVKLWSNCGQNSFAGNPQEVGGWKTLKNTEKVLFYKRKSPSERMDFFI